MTVGAGSAIAASATWPNQWGRSSTNPRSQRITVSHQVYRYSPRHIALDVRARLKRFASSTAGVMAIALRRRHSPVVVVLSDVPLEKAADTRPQPLRNNWTELVRIGLQKRSIIATVHHWLLTASGGAIIAEDEPGHRHQLFCMYSAWRLTRGTLAATAQGSFGSRAGLSDVQMTVALPSIPTVGAMTGDRRRDG